MEAMNQTRARARAIPTPKVCDARDKVKTGHSRVLAEKWRARAVQLNTARGKEAALAPECIDPRRGTSLVRPMTATTKDAVARGPHNARAFGARAPPGQACEDGTDDERTARPPQSHTAIVSAFHRRERWSVTQQER